MSTYEQRLSQFSQEKRLSRLSRPLRDRADACCDACGSTQPRTLFALKDLHTGRHYFVGDTCLKELTKRGAVLRRYSRESGQKAYESEMVLRAQEQERGKAPLREDNAVAPSTENWLPLLGRKWRSRSDSKCLRRLAKRSPTVVDSP